VVGYGRANVLGERDAPTADGPAFGGPATLQPGALDVEFMDHLLPVPEVGNGDAENFPDPQAARNANQE